MTVFFWLVKECLPPYRSYGVHIVATWRKKVTIGLHAFLVVLSHTSHIYILPAMGAMGAVKERRQKNQKSQILT